MQCGGGTKAQNDRATALSAILDARLRVKEDPKSSENGEGKPKQAFSIYMLHLPQFIEEVLLLLSLLRVIKLMHGLHCTWPKKGKL